MYEELVRDLRNWSKAWGEEPNPVGPVPVRRLAMAADAIEELKKEVLEWQKCRDLERSLRMALEMKIPRWISVEEKLPEESEGLNWHEDMMIRFTSVWCCDAKTGTIEVRNRLQRKMIWNDCLDHYTKDTAWHWSKSWWEPTHWMPIVPLPELPKEET